MSLKELIREKRIALGLSKRKLAARLGITHAAVVFWENGSHAPTEQHRIALAQVFGLPVEALADTVEANVSAFTSYGTSDETQRAMARQIAEAMVSLAVDVTSYPPDTALELIASMRRHMDAEMKAGLPTKLDALFA
jgi:transcriptional regulator with XRE-family HTH domain